MIWTKYTIKTTTKDADMVSAILMDHDINDVQIENNVQLTDEELNQMYADFVKELPPDDGSCSLSFYMEFHDEEDEETKAMLAALEADLKEAAELFGIEPVELICEDLNSDNWENNWKEFFKPFTVGKILIAPTWEELPEDLSTFQTSAPGHAFVHAEDNETAEDVVMLEPAEIPELVIRIDPGMAFGTGTHETTRLCIRELQTYLKPGDKVLDLGCGSGILGIAALRLGAASAVSVDIDEQAVRVAKENFEVNEISEEGNPFFVGNVVTDEELQKTLLQTGGGQTDAAFGPYDIVTVNILADVINVMMPTLDRYLRKGGVLITSGILKEKEELIRNAITANSNLKLIEVREDGDWVSITAERI